MAEQTNAQAVMPSAVMSEFRVGWTIIIVAAIGMACGLSAIPIYSIGTFTKPLTEAFGWSRAEVQGIYSWMTVGNLVAAPILGLLIDRHGVRKVALVSVVGTALGYAALGLATGPLWSFYLVAFITAVVGVGTVPITWTRVVVDWFDAGRGRALGLALSGTGISAMLLPVYATWIIGEYGWRMAFVGLALLPALIGLPAVYFLLYDRNAPRNAAKLADVAAPLKEIGGIEFKTALKGYRFWALNIVFFMIGICIAGLIAHLVPMLTDRGLDPVTAAQIAGIIGAAVIVGRIGTGYLIDRFWAPGVGLVLLSLPAISCLILATGFGGTPGALLAALLIGLAAGAEFDLMAFLVSQYFGQKRYGIIYACIYATFKISAGVGTPLFGFAFDETGSYNTILYLAVGSFIGSSMLLLLLGRYPA
ncbi:MAG: MFS transporter, partial [Rhodospirillaceae bacterium]|nr:MFS transporter [Rhodospirillaceae bacterium]